MNNRLIAGAAFALLALAGARIGSLPAAGYAYADEYSSSWESSSASSEEWSSSSESSSVSSEETSSSSDESSSLSSGSSEESSSVSSAYCGNAIVDSGEECDDGGESDACSASCQVIMSICSCKCERNDATMCHNDEVHGNVHRCLHHPIKTAKTKEQCASHVGEKCTGYPKGSNLARAGVFTSCQWSQSYSSSSDSSESSSSSDEGSSSSY